ncbi:MAG TPA: DMT family protein [Candidatus Acidoferrum sp.]
MDFTSSRWLPVVLLTLSNIFMTVAWYGNLNPKFKNSPLWLVILASWGLAFFEYVFMIPANRWGSSVYSVTQLKIIQEVITLSVFCVFAILFLGEKIRWNYIAAFVCILAAVAFAFWPKPQ